MKELTVLEQIILAAVHNLAGEAYGLAIRKKIGSLTGRRLMYGTLYNALDQLHRKGFIRKIKAPPGTADGMSRGRVYYGLTPSGNAALKAAYELQSAIWGSIPDLIEGGET